MGKKKNSPARIYLETSIKTNFYVKTEAKVKVKI